VTPHDRLEADRETTLEQIDDLTAELAGIVASTELVATDDEHDPEGATIAFERARVDALLAAAREHLKAIDHAEARLAAGTYGVCESCGQSIGDARLEARPTASTCISCASR
jgi:RNA polymerase-binding transcription factor DksA